MELMSSYKPLNFVVVVVVVVSCMDCGFANLLTLIITASRVIIQTTRYEKSYIRSHGVVSVFAMQRD